MPDDNTTPTADSGIVFGLAEYKNSVAGVHLQNLTFGEECSDVEAIDEDGNTEQIDQYAKKKTVQGEGNVVSGGSIAVTVGGDLTIANITYKITSCSKKYSVNGHCSFTFSGKAPMPAASSAATAQSNG